MTTPVLTLVDLASGSSPAEIERAVNEADRLNLVDPESLRQALAPYRGRRGVARLRLTLDRRTFRLTDSELERRFLRLVATAAIPSPATGVHVERVQG